MIARGKRPPLGDRILWAFTRSFWIEAGLTVVFGLISNHQGVAS